MPVISIFSNGSNIELTAEQAKFALMIEEFPWLSHYWNWKRVECNLSLLKKEMGGFSHGEQVLVQFFLSVWTHDHHSFDLLEAASILSAKEKKIIIDWFSDPFWP